MRPFIQFSSRNIQKSAAYFLSFHIDNDYFAANFPKIAGFSKEFSFEPYNGKITYIDGLAKINNEEIPVINLKSKLGMSNMDLSKKGKLVVFEMEIFNTILKFGIFYDMLGDALEIPVSKMMQVPNVGDYFEKGNIKGIFIHENQTLFILDFDTIFTIDDLIDIKVAFISK
jgi:chemotaxis signal transduction protein